MTVPRPGRLGLRASLLLAVLAAIGLVLAGLTVGFNLVLAARLDGDANGVVQARASAELAALRVSRPGARIVLPEAPDESAPDTQIWVFQGAKAIEHPSSATAADPVAAALATGPRASRDVTSTHTRLYALPIVQSGRRLGTVVAGVSLSPYEQTRRTGLFASAVFALAIFTAVGLAARWLISRALRPVARMTSQAAEWSDRDLDRRFSLGPPRDELTHLAHTLDGLLDRLATSLRHEQRLSAELSHELRTPLANITAEAQFAVRHTRQTPEGRAALEHILQSTTLMGRTLDTLIAAARAELNPHRATSDATVCARAAAAACTPLGTGTGAGVEISIESAPGALRVAVEQDLVERILAPLVENACRHAAHEVSISIARDAGAVLFAIQDDGAGVPVEEQDSIFRPGHRVGPSEGTAVAYQGAGLGLALSRRLARSAGGDVEARDSNSGGRFVVRLPAA
jgi:two-component system OmpR family sensor kinase